MSEKKMEILAGLFVTLGLFVLIFGIVWLKGGSVIKRSYRVPVAFSDAGGLRVGDPVDIAGVRKGRVAGIALRPHDVLVSLEVEKDVFLPEDSRLTMRNLSLLSGEKYIKIELGTSPKPFDPQKPFRGDYYDEFSIANVVNALKKINDLLSQIDVKSITQKVDSGIGAIFESSKKSLSVLENRSADLNHLIINLERISTNLDTVVAALKNKQGTLGRLIFDDKPYNEIMSTNQELKSLIQDIKNHPERYLKVKVF
jgi:phospholipid/cholesterol/gamma-HCH transport system substrate-binding protein